MELSKNAAQNILLAAALYNLIWGAAVVLFPRWTFELSGMPAPTSALFLWQCIGMIVGVYGVGYAAASLDPFRHWPIVLVGFLGKVCGPIGFLSALMRREIEPGFLVHIIPNDLIWWLPFALILYTALTRYQSDEAPVRERALLDLQVFRDDESAAGTIAELSKLNPLLVVLLRHAGCCFCRELVAEIGSKRELLEREAQIVLVTMEETSAFRALVKQHGLGNCFRAVDSNADAYRAAGLRRAPLHRLFGLREILRGAVATLRYGIGGLAGDGWMPSGAVLVSQGIVLKRSLTSRASDQPDLCLTEGVV